KRSGPIRNRPNTEVTDLPGIYSLSPYTGEEVVSRQFILNEKPHGIINIVDATNLERSLYLTMQLLELDIPTVLALNMMDEVKGKYMYYVALGNQLNFSPKCNMFVDLMSSYENIDRKGIMTGIFDGQDEFNGHNMYNTLYNSLVAKVNWRFQPKWNFFVKGMLESAAIYRGQENKDIYNGNVADGNYRTSVGYLAGLEYYPMESNLHLFLTFVGQTHLFTERAKVLGKNDYSTQRVSLGFIYQLPVY
ncbi:MAG: hypothetical protein II198_02885, partial [Bacteroidaceae bacterium]|nr:hypothetical protein [Bacteroidaceae bacterium]